MSEPSRSETLCMQDTSACTFRKCMSEMVISAFLPDHDHLAGLVVLNPSPITLDPRKPTAPWRKYRGDLCACKWAIFTRSSIFAPAVSRLITASEARYPFGLDTSPCGFRMKFRMSLLGRTTIDRCPH